MNSKIHQVEKSYVEGLIQKLEDALASVEVKTQKSKQVLAMAERYLADSKYYLEKDDNIVALGAVEYGHGLLDGAVGCGGLKVLKNEELFVF